MLFSISRTDVSKQLTFFPPIFQALAQIKYILRDLFWPTIMPVSPLNSCSTDFVKHNYI